MYLALRQFDIKITFIILNWSHKAAFTPKGIHTAETSSLNVGSMCGRNLSSCDTIRAMGMT